MRGVRGVPSVGAGRPREFALVFANPISSEDSERRELLTVSTSGHYFTDLLYEIWQLYQFPYPPSTSWTRSCGTRCSTR